MIPKHLAKKAQLFMPEETVRIVLGILGLVLIVGIFVYIIVSFTGNSELKKAEATLKQIKAEIDKLQAEKVFVYVSEQRGITLGVLGTNKVNFYYRFDNNELFWKSDAEKDKEKWHGLWYDKEKGVASSDKLGEHESNEEKAEGVIKGPRQVYNLLRNNLERIDVLMASSGLLNKMGVKYENIVVPREFFFIAQPKEWRITAWPYQSYSEKPNKCSQWQYCLCICDLGGNVGNVKSYKLNKVSAAVPYLSSKDQAIKDCDKKGICIELKQKISIDNDALLNILTKDDTIQLSESIAKVSIMQKKEGIILKQI